ncbi:MAG: hypothetical protein PVF47_05995 [Anaerolineae bacterium]|jgi:hypothetical protein
MKRTIWILSGILVLLAAGAFVAGRLLLAGASGTDGDSPMVNISTGSGQVVSAELVPAKELPESPPDVVGAFSRRLDNSIFVDETEGGFVISRDESGSFSVANATGQIKEVVVTRDTAVYVNLTLEKMDQALVDGKLYQQVKPGSVEEIGDMSFVQAWGEMHGERLVANVLLYNRPPVIAR